MLDASVSSAGQDVRPTHRSQNRGGGCRQALGLLLAALAAAPSVAQTVPPTFLVTYSNPGARSVGFGGAFVALADDATGAFSNPAGLDQLTRPELSAELRLEISNDPAATQDASDLTGLGFISFVYPAQNWSLAAYGNRLASGGLGFADALDVKSHGFSAAYRVSDALSVGLGLSHFDGRLGDLASTDWGITAGMLWRLSPLWKAGAFYRQGADLEFDPDLRLVIPLDLPDTGGVGLAYRTSNGNFTAAFEWDRVRYSSLLESNATEGLVLDDGDELHLGGEYALLQTKPVVAFRFGLWRDPDHQVRGPRQRSRGAETHHALGLGLVFRRLQLDLGADFSDLESILSISLVYGL
jgi:hypothetical protein